MKKEYSKKIRKTVEQLNVIDDELFRKMAEDEGFCEEILSTILGKEIRVLVVTPQKDIKNLQGRSVVLDALCTDKSGRNFNVEVQKENNDDHQRRVRYISACITANIAQPGTFFRDVPDVVVVFIARFDIFGGGKSLYHVDRVVRETGEVVRNGFAEIYVNASARDGSDVAALMEIFTKNDAYDYEKFPKTSDRKRQFKKTEKGEAGVSRIVEEFAKEYSMSVDVKRVESCSRNLGLSIEDACKALDISYVDYAAAKELLNKPDI